MSGIGKVYDPSPAWMRFLVRSPITRSVVALKEVDLSLQAGHISAVVGPNGAGKTTMFRILTGLTTPTTGSARVMGFDAHHQSVCVRRVIGWMPAEDRSLYMRLTCRENLYFHGRLQGIPRNELRTRIPEQLEQVGLGSKIDHSIFALSAGMRARLQLARALLHRPKLLILDEPTAAVDPVGAHELLGIIMDLVAEFNLAALISSHRLEEIEALHSHVVLLDKGSIRYQGNLDDLRRQWNRPQVELVFSSAASATQACAVLGSAISSVSDDGRTIRVSLAVGQQVGSLLTHLGTLTSSIIHIRELTLPLRDLLAQMYSGRALPVGAMQ